MKIKKMLSLLIAIALVTCAFVPTAFAAELYETGEINTSDISLSGNEMSPKMQRAITYNDLAVGETQFAGQFEDGTALYVTLISDTNSDPMTRATSKVTSKSWMFQTVNVFGVKVDAFKVAMKCYWTEDGSDSEIQTLNGTYTIYDSSFTCSWDEDNASANPTYHALPLDVYHGGGSAYYIFDAILNTLVSPATCTISYGVW